MLANLTIPASTASRPRLLVRRVFVLSASLAAVAAVAWLVLLFGTRAIGLEAALANGTSMEPALHHGDALVLGDADPASIHVGDVVWALHEGWPIMHRVVEIYSDPGGERIVVTKGDNLPEADPPVKATDVKGQLVLKVPVLGAAARTVGLEDGYRLLVLLEQGFAATSIIFGLVYLEGARRSAGEGPRSTSPSVLF